MARQMGCRKHHSPPCVVKPVFGNDHKRVWLTIEPISRNTLLPDRRCMHASVLYRVSSVTAKREASQLMRSARRLLEKSITPVTSVPSLPQGSPAQGLAVAPLDRSKDQGRNMALCQGQEDMSMSNPPCWRSTSLRIPAVLLRPTLLSGLGKAQRCGLQEVGKDFRLSSTSSRVR